MIGLIGNMTPDTNPSWYITDVSIS